MKSIHILLTKLVAVVLCLLWAGASTAPVHASQLSWTIVPDGPASDAAPALAEYNGRIYMVAVDTRGHVYYTTTSQPDTWAAWQIIGPPHEDPPPCQWPPACIGSQLSDRAFHADPTTEPVLVRASGMLVLFARGKDNNLYRATKVNANDWSPWEKLTSDGSVRGRISVTVTLGPFVATHVVYASQEPFGVGIGTITIKTVKYIRFVGLGPEQAETEKWVNAREAAIESNGWNEVVILLRYSTELKVMRGWTATDTYYPSWYWSTIGTRVPGPFNTEISDISNPVFFAGYYHFTYTLKTVGGINSGLAHVRMKGPVDEGFFTLIPINLDSAEISPQQEVLSQLSVYRNKLFLAYKDVDGKVRTAYLDTATQAPGWMSLGTIGRTSRRPVLASFNKRPSLSEAAYLQANYGNDLFAAVRGYTGGRIWFINFSRALFMKRLDRIGLAVRYCAEYPGGMSGCPDVSNLPANVADLPVFSEVGYGTIALPNWLMSKIYVRTMATTDTPDAKYNTWIHTQNITAYIGPNLNIDSGADYLTWMEEMGHRLASSLGLCDSSNSCTSPRENLMDDDIPNSAIRDAFDLFNQRVRSNQSCAAGADADGRCRGFTGIANNYDVTTRQHSWIYVLYYYLKDGDYLRGLVQQDLNAGDRLLCDKYHWIKTHIFHGAEFKKHSDPLNEP